MLVADLSTWNMYHQLLMIRPKEQAFLAMVQIHYWSWRLEVTPGIEELTMPRNMKSSSQRRTCSLVILLCPKSTSVLFCLFFCSFLLNNIEIWARRWNLSMTLERRHDVWKQASKKTRPNFLDKTKSRTLKSEQDIEMWARHLNVSKTLTSEQLSL